MNPHFRAEILAMTTAELAERNGARLLAQQLQSAARDDEADIARYEAESRAYIACPGMHNMRDVSASHGKIENAPGGSRRIERPL